MNPQQAHTLSAGSVVKYGNHMIIVVCYIVLVFISNDLDFGLIILMIVPLVKYCIIVLNNFRISQEKYSHTQKFLLVVVSPTNLNLISCTSENK